MNARAHMEEERAYLKLRQVETQQKNARDFTGKSCSQFCNRTLRDNFATKSRRWYCGGMIRVAGAPLQDLRPRHRRYSD
jgi:hypothetical protein